MCREKKSTHIVAQTVSRQKRKTVGKDSTAASIQNSKTGVPVGKVMLCPCEPALGGIGKKVNSLSVYIF